MFVFLDFRSDPHTISLGRKFIEISLGFQAVLLPLLLLKIAEGLKAKFFFACFANSFNLKSQHLLL